MAGKKAKVNKKLLNTVQQQVKVCFLQKNPSCVSPSRGSPHSSQHVSLADRGHLIQCSVRILIISLSSFVHFAQHVQADFCGTQGLHQASGDLYIFGMEGQILVNLKKKSCQDQLWELGLFSLQKRGMRRESGARWGHQRAWYPPAVELSQRTRCSSRHHQAHPVRAHYTTSCSTPGAGRCAS